MFFTKRTNKSNRDLYGGTEGQSVLIPSSMLDATEALNIKLVFAQEELLIYKRTSFALVISKIPYSNITRFDVRDFEIQSKCYITIYCNSPILKRFDDSPDWRFSTSKPNNISILSLTYNSKTEEAKTIVNKIKSLLEENTIAFKESDKGKQTSYIQNQIDSLPFVKSFVGFFSCSFSSFIASLNKTECSSDYTNVNTGINKGTKYYFLLDKKRKKFAVIVDEKLQYAAEGKLLTEVIQNPERYYELFKEANFNKFLALWNSYDEILNIEFVSNVDKITIQKPTPSGLSLALQSELIHPMYAIGSILESQKQSLGEIDLSQYCIIFKKLKVKCIYINHILFDSNDALKDLAHEIKVRNMTVDQTPVSTSKADKLIELKNLLEQKLITQEEYDEARRNIINS